MRVSVNKYLRKAYNFMQKFSFEIKALSLFIMLVLPRTVMGFKYYPVVDDWFLYYGRSTFDHILDAINWSTRPFASIADICVYTRFVDVMIAAEIFLCLLLALGAVFMSKAFSENKIANGAVFMLTATMMPIGFEGTYWMAAASRISPSFFFIGLSIYSQTRYIDSRQVKYLFIFIVSGIFSVGFYEMFIPVYLFLAAVIVLKKKKTWWIMIIPVLIASAMALYYKLNFNEPEISDRVEFVTANSFVSHVTSLLKDYGLMFGKVHAQLLKESFFDGVAVFAKKPVWLVMTAVSSIVFAVVSKKAELRKSLVSDFFIGLGIIFSGIGVNFVISYVRMPFRISFLPCIGIGLILEAILCRLFSAKLDIVYKIAAAAMAMFFAVCSAGEVAMYKRTYEADFEHCIDILNFEKVTDNKYTTIIFNEKSYWFDDRLQYWEYVKCAGENSSVLTGMIRYIINNSEINEINTVHENEVTKERYYERPYYFTLYVDNEGKVRECEVKRHGADYNIYSVEGEFIGSLTKCDSGFRYNTF